MCFDRQPEKGERQIEFIWTSHMQKSPVLASEPWDTGPLFVSLYIMLLNGLGWLEGWLACCLAVWLACHLSTVWRCQHLIYITDCTDWASLQTRRLVEPLYSTWHTKKHARGKGLPYPEISRRIFNFYRVSDKTEILKKKKTVPVFQTYGKC